jgi:hypothetical protein
MAESGKAGIPFTISLLLALAQRFLHPGEPYDARLFGVP